MTCHKRVSALCRVDTVTRDRFLGIRCISRNPGLNGTPGILIFHTFSPSFSNRNHNFNCNKS